jgi:hypothetical protein
MSIKNRHALRLLKILFVMYIGHVIMYIGHVVMYIGHVIIFKRIKLFAKIRKNDRSKNQIDHFVIFET